MIVEHCKQWVEDFVIRYNLCPFAHPFAKKGQILYRLSQKEGLESRLHEFLEEMDFLEEDTDFRTTLLIYADEHLDFLSYLELYELCEAVIEKEERPFQLASFHPHYCFAGVAYSDPANLSNRSPYPIIHILRLDDVAAAIASHPDTTLIPQRNIEFLRQKYGKR